MNRSLVARGIVLGLLVGVLMVFALNVGLDWGLRNQARRDAMTGYYEAGCNDIVRSESGRLVCEVEIEHEDDNIKVFRGVAAK